jgi:hypothetical protein
MLATVAQDTNAPAVTTVLDGLAYGADLDGDDHEMEFWDWLVLWWTSHLGDWPM